MHSYFYGLVLGLVLCAGCRPQASTPQNEKEHKTITISIDPLRYATEQIAGDEFNVITFVPKGSSPETYEPTPEQMMKLNESLIYFSVGELGFERTWLPKLQQTAPNIPFVKTSENIRYMKEYHHGNLHSSIDEADPHVWTSPRNMKTIAQNICTALCRIDTTHAQKFQSNLNRLLADIQTTDDSIHKLVDHLPQRAFLIYHPTLTYFAKDYGLEQITIETDGKEPSPSQLVQLIQKCKARHVKIIFRQQEFDRKNAEIIAKETGTRLIDINPLSPDWKHEMLKIAHTLQEQ
ncbi:MAG: zinc ABC transporter substrate-binding protein [Paraprevotella sp.]|nr:zinc ABC transporter substrate-binding protein [Paraprevotella sp.]